MAREARHRRLGVGSAGPSQPGEGRCLIESFFGVCGVPNLKAGAMERALNLGALIVSDLVPVRAARGNGFEGSRARGRRAMAAPPWGQDATRPG